MRGFIAVGRAILNLIYGFHKLAGTQNKIVIMSRQADVPTLDIELLSAELRKQNPAVIVKVMCRTLGKGFGAKIRYLFYMIGPQMHQIATAKVVVLDSYCIPISILKHKKSLKVLQMWHAMGGFKKFGYSILDSEEGSSSMVAQAMRMHKNYDCILASSEKGVGFFGEAFGYDPSYFKVLPLPRTDLLRSETYMENKKREILKALPQLRGKKTILYAPTFRTGGSEWTDITHLIEEVDYDEYNLVIAPHPLMSDKADYGNAIVAKQFTTLELLSVCQYFITDYSAVIYEAALAHKPIFLYTYDLQKYKDNRGFYINYEEELPEKPLCSAKEVMDAIRFSYYNVAGCVEFAEKYISDEADCTGAIAGLIYEMMES